MFAAVNGKIGPHFRPFERLSRGGRYWSRGAIPRGLSKAGCCCSEGEHARESGTSEHATNSQAESGFSRARYTWPPWLAALAQTIGSSGDRPPDRCDDTVCPGGCRGIVSIDGVIQLRRILIPVDREPNAQEAVIRAVRAAEAFGDEAVEIVILHVNGGVLPQFDRPETQACVWKELRRKGDVAPTILDVARNVDLIVMATEGRHGVVDALRGSVTERVVRGASCPVLAVPRVK